MPYKLTDEHGQTHGGTQWGPGVTHTATGTGTKLCSNGWIHYYETPELAVLLNPIHANFRNPRLWEFVAEGDTAHDHGLKSGCKRGTTVQEILLPTVTTNQRVRFAILVAKAVYRDPKWNAWANAWLSGQSRTRDAAWSAAAAADAAYAAADAATAAAAATYAARAAAYDAATYASSFPLAYLARQALQGD